jgi:hypothetical protein
LTDSVGISSSYQSEDKTGFLKRYPHAPSHDFQRKRYDKICYVAKLHKSSYSNAWKYKDDIMKMKALEKQYHFIVKYDIKSEFELDKRYAIYTENRSPKSL